VPLPAGTKKLELRFEPQSYKTGSMLTTVASIIVILLLLVGLFMEIRKQKADTKLTV
jgi:uncharacterized membrane protein YfhO